MSDTPPIELLESTHQFPGGFLFKVIGRPENEFADRVLAAIREVLNSEIEVPVRITRSGGGKYISVGVEPVVESAQQVLDVFEQLKKLQGLVCVL